MMFDDFEMRGWEDSEFVIEFIVQYHLRFMSSITVALIGSVTLLFEARQVKIDIKSDRFKFRIFNSFRTRPCGPIVYVESMRRFAWYQFTDGEGFPVVWKQKTKTNKHNEDKWTNKNGNNKTRQNKTKKTILE